MKKLTFFAVCVLFLLLSAWGARFTASLPVDKINWQQAEGLIVSADKQTPVRLEVADTPEKQQVGLMYRKKMGFENGMIFLFSQPKKATMWMKNTFIPLDMIFFDNQFVVRHIHLNARPHDETIIRTPMPISGVIEVNAGFVKQHHISLGDKLVYPVKPDYLKRPVQ